MSRRKQAVQDLLLRHGIKPSYQRLQVLGQLLAHGGHQTADEIQHALADVRPAIARATIYNTLNQLVDHGILERFTIDRLETRYDLRLERHGHFVCTSCGAIHDVPLPARPDYAALEGFAIEREEWILKGSCPGCREQIDQSPATGTPAVAAQTGHDGRAPGAK